MDLLMCASLIPNPLLQEVGILKASEANTVELCMLENTRCMYSTE